MDEILGGTGLSSFINIISNRHLSNPSSHFRGGNRELPGPEGWAHGPSANDQAAHGQDLGAPRRQDVETSLSKDVGTYYNDI